MPVAAGGTLEEKVCGKFEWRRYVGAVVVNCVYVK